MYIHEVDVSYEVPVRVSFLFDAPVGNAHGGEEERVLADEGGVDRAVHEVRVLQHV